MTPQIPQPQAQWQGDNSYSYPNILLVPYYRTNSLTYLVAGQAETL